MAVGVHEAEVPTGVDGVLQPPDCKNGRTFVACAGGEVDALGALAATRPVLPPIWLADAVGRHTE